MPINSLGSRQETLEQTSTPNRPTRGNGINGFRTKFWTTAALIMKLATSEKTRDDEVFDNYDNPAEATQILSLDEQELIAQGITDYRIETNIDVNDTAPIEFTSTDFNNRVMERAA